MLQLRGKKFLALLLVVAMLISQFTMLATAAPTPYEEAFEPSVTYTPTLTPEERTAIHDAVEALAGDVGDAVVGDGRYNRLTLVGAMLDGSSYDSISRAGGGTAPTAYPFPVSNTTSNLYEYDRKAAKLKWVVKLAEDLGFPVVVQRQADKVVYVEIGDPDAPEMVMALSHLDSPPASVTSAQIARWRSPDGSIGTDPDAFHTPYVKDGWIYGAGMQDDSGPTLATLLAAKAMMEAGVPMDRRVRIVMGIYEDSSPARPTPDDTKTFMNIPYYTSSPSFYDNWAYKYLNREETPIAGYTSDSRFPVIVGNSQGQANNATTPFAMSLAGDAGKAFRLTAATAGVTLRAGDPTLKDIVYGSANQIASRAIFTLDVTGVSADDRNSFIDSVNAAATAQGWLPTLPGKTPKVQAEISGDTIVVEINTDVAMEFPTPQFGKNAVVWGMHLLSKAFDAKGITSADLQLKKAADGIADLFFRGGVEGEAYIGRYMGIPEDLLRNPDNGAPNLTFALMGGINTENLTSFYTAGTGSLSIPMQIRYMHTNAADYNTATAAASSAVQNKGFTLTFPTFANPTLYVTHDNPLTALQLASYRASMNHDPAAFSDVYGLLDIAYPQGTTGGTLAGNFQNKMTAFGAIIPGNERWWHTANERMKVDSAVQMTKIMADGMQEMARYSGPAGAKFMWADIPGLNADRADLDLLDVTIGTFKDASDVVTPEHLDNKALLAATAFDIPMWSGRGNSSPTAAAYESGSVYLQTNNADFLANTFVAPMRLEFKVQRSGNMTDADWNVLVNGDMENFSFNILMDGNVVPLTVPEGASADKFFSKRISKNDPNTVYVSVNIAIKDAPYEGVETVIVDSKTDLYSLNPTYLASNPDPFPERGAKEERGFFLFGDGSKDARFASPDAIYVTDASNRLHVTTGAYLVKKGEYFRVNSYFDEAVKSNAAILDFTFDTSKYEYRGYTPAEGVTVLNTPVVTATGVKITVMIEDYNAKDFGEVLMSAKEDADLKNERNAIELKLDYVLKDEATGEKAIYTATASTSFTSTGGGKPGGKPGPNPPDPDDDWTLIDLSNMIDLFGINNTHELWESEYQFFDYNNNGEIDINDICYVAKLIK